MAWYYVELGSTILSVAVLCGITWYYVEWGSTMLSGTGLCLVGQ